MGDEVACVVSLGAVVEAQFLMVLEGVGLGWEFVQLIS